MFLTAYQLFYKRIQQEWKYQTKLFFSVVDWVTGLYIIIPLLLVGGYHFIQLWQKNYTWPNHTTLFMLLIGLFVWSLTGSIRFYMEDADQILLRQHHKVYRRMREFGILYSSLQSNFTTAIMFLIISPVYFRYVELSLWIFVTYFLMTIGFRFLHQLLKSYLYLPFRKRYKYLLTIGSLLLNCFAFLGLGILIVWLDSYAFIYLKDDLSLIHIAVWLILATMFFIIVYTLVQKRLSLSWSFQHDCTYEQMEKQRIERLFLQQAIHIGEPDVTRKKKKQGKRHILGQVWFKRKVDEHSNRQYTSHRVISAIFFRYVLRNKERMFSAQRITAVFIVAVLLIPGIMKWVMWIVSIGVILLFFKSIWNEWVEHEFLKLFNWHYEIKRHDAMRAIFMCSIPTIALSSLTLGTVLFSEWIGVLTIGLGLLLSLVISLLLDVNLGNDKFSYQKEEREK